jgi:ATP-dependent RNA helicase DDX56/DBP9
VSFVLNVDFAPNPRSYAHRVGRTARGGATGVALSLVDAASPDERDVLRQVQEDQPPIPLAAASAGRLQAVAAVPSSGADEGPAPHREQPQPIPLDFDLREIEGFRYRVEDVSRAVTRSAVREARAAELRAEILNSDRLQSRLGDNPAELQLLQHDRVATHASRVQEHLKHVPSYLLPRGMQVANLNRKKRKRRNKRASGGARRTDNDPLHAFDGDTNSGEGDADEGDDVFADFMDDGEPDDSSRKAPKIVAEEKIFTSTKDGTGFSTAGRNAWKEKHRKGKFSGKKRKADRKHGQPLGI